MEEEVEEEEEVEDEEEGSNVRRQNWKLGINLGQRNGRREEGK